MSEINEVEAGPESVPVAVPEEIPEATPVAVPEEIPAEIPEATPVVAAVGGPEIVYIGDGAENVAFTINPKALRYVVNANGLVTEDMQ